MIMIDWLDVQIPFTHTAIEQGAYMVVNYEGVIERNFAIRRRVEGSHDATIGFSSQTLPEFAATTPLGKVSHLCFSGNPAKFIQGHNVCGIECVRSLVALTMRVAMPLLGFSDFDLHRVLDRVDNWDFIVTRVDITRMLLIGNGTDQDVCDYLYMLPQQARGRGGRVTSVNGTFYIGQKSTVWTIKIYNKYQELLKAHKGHGLPPHLKESGLLEWCKGQARIELTLRKKELNKNGGICPRYLQQNIDGLFNEYLERIDMNQQSITVNQINHIPRHLQATFLLWREGENVKAILPKTTFYRQRTDLLEFDVDIAIPPVREENRTCHTAKLHRIISPRGVSQVPPSLMAFMAKPEARYAQ